MAAEMVGDRDDHASWRARRDAWVAETERALRSLPDALPLDAFKATAVTPAANNDVTTDLAAELTVLRSCLSVLLLHAQAPSE
jgi:hypothetical protein